MYSGHPKKPLTSYFYVGVKSVPPEVEVRQLVQYAMQLQPYNQPQYMLYGSRQAYCMDTRIESVGWKQMTFPEGVGDFVEAFWHTHADMTEDLWAFAGMLLLMSWLCHTAPCPTSSILDAPCVTAPSCPCL